MAATLTARRPLPSAPVARVDFPEDTESHGVAHYAITEAPPLRRGMAARCLDSLFDLYAACRSYPGAIVRVSR